MKNSALLLLHLLLLTNCGYEDFGHIGPSSPSYKTSGIYTGTLSNNGVSTNFTGIAHEFSFTGINLNGGIVYSSGIQSIIFSNNYIDTSLNVLTIDTGFDRAALLNAKVTNNNIISGTITDQGSVFSFEWTLNPIYNRTPYQNLAGTYSVFSSGATFTVTSDNGGDFTGSDTDGCNYSGTQLAYDTTKNLYKLQLTVTNCNTSDGTYQGYSFNDDSTIENDLLVWIVDDLNYVLLLSMLRQ